MLVWKLAVVPFFRVWDYEILTATVHRTLMVHSREDLWHSPEVQVAPVVQEDQELQFVPVGEKNDSQNQI